MNDPKVNSDFDDPRLPLKRAVQLGVKALLVIMLVSLAIWGGLKGLPGIWGVLIGAGFVLCTALSVLFTAKSTPSTTIAVVLGGWLLKLVLLLGVLAVIREMDFYDTWALFLSVVAALVVTLGTEVWGIVTSKVTYVA